MNNMCMLLLLLNSTFKRCIATCSTLFIHVQPFAGLYQCHIYIYIVIYTYILTAIIWLSIR